MFCQDILIIKNGVVQTSSKSEKVKHELRVQIHELRVRIHELRVQIHELRVQIHELRVRIHEFRDQIYNNAIIALCNVIK